MNAAAGGSCLCSENMTPGACGSTSPVAAAASVETLVQLQQLALEDYNL